MYRKFFFLLIVFSSLFSQEKIPEQEIKFNQKNQKHKLKDIVRVLDYRNNQLVGYGIVVGLKGTGDSKFITNREIISKILEKMNIQIRLDGYEPRNTASVLVTAEIPPFAKKGDRITCIVSSIGDAKSLSGGVLIQTPLYGANGNIYAVAQGKLLLEKNISKIEERTTTATIPFGAIIERNLEDKDVSNSVRLQLNEFDILSLNSIYKFLKEKYPNLNTKIDGGGILINFPENQFSLGELSKILEEEILLPEKTKIIINQNSKIIVAIGNILIKPFYIGRVYVPSNYEKIQKEAYQGIYVRTPSDEFQYKNMIYIQANSMEELVNEFNKSNLSIEDIINVLQMLIESGYIKAELIIR
ncbi:MAG: flagellar basal body P-ring protein FlgI [Leptonema sp. (in: bacteria)]